MGAGYAVSVRLLFSCLIVELKSHSSGIGKETWREHGEKEGKWRRWGKVEKTDKWRSEEVGRIKLEATRMSWSHKEDYTHARPCA